MKKLAILSLIVILAVGCNSKKAAFEGDAEFTILAERGYGGRSTPSHELVKDQAELEALYRSMRIEEIPAVDFSKNNVVAVFMGQKPTGGYSITIDKVEIKGNTAMILVKNTVPEPGAILTMAITNPYCIAAIPKTEKAEVKENPVKM